MTSTACRLGSTTAAKIRHVLLLFAAKTIVLGAAEEDLMDEPKENDPSFAAKIKLVFSVAKEKGQKYTHN